MKRHITLAAMACLLAGASMAAAQTTKGQKPAAASQKAAASKHADASFVHEAAIGGLAEVELGRLATQNASSDDVKQFGQRMVDDHGKANDELKALAAKKGITLPTELDQKHQALRDRLAKQQGAAFDKAYMSEMLSDHQKDVAAFQREAKSGSDPDVKAWAQKTLPTLQEHLKMAKATRGKTAGSAKEQTSGKKPPTKS